ncbi:MAG: hypothetical protein ACRDHO_11235, partial [Actinomycetota bacterium]
TTTIARPPVPGGSLRSSCCGNPLPQATIATAKAAPINTTGSQLPSASGIERNLSSAPRKPKAAAQAGPAKSPDEIAANRTVRVAEASRVSLPASLP